MTIATKILMRLTESLKKFRSIKMTIRANREAKRVFSSSEMPPILIYQMGKVGSSAVYKSLKDTVHTNHILHLHMLSSEHIDESIKWRKKRGIYSPNYSYHLAKAARNALNNYKGNPIKVISLVRDPIARMISNIFQNPSHSTESLISDKGIIDGNKVIKYIEKEIHNPKTFDWTYSWLDRELKAVLNIDAFAKPFPVETGYAKYQNEKVEALIIRLEDLSEKGPKAVSDFLGLSEPIVLKKANVRAYSEDAKEYQKVLSKICLSPSLCREIYSSRFVKHFYNETMVNNFVLKWSKSNN